MASRSRVVKSKVKSGCRTCKIRKVKCDEKRPACLRCVSTGRVCDGYGIWSEGEIRRGRRENYEVSATGNAALPVSISLYSLDTEEKDSFEWFTYRTALKLPGSYTGSGFWSTLIFQASFEEPAVRHAVIALSSVHRRGVMSVEDQSVALYGSANEERFALEHYVKAIGRLQQHFSVGDRRSFRVASIACITFVYLEFLRGYFKTAQIHLQNGLQILRNGLIPTSGPHLDSIDAWLVEVFSRLHLQMQLIEHIHQRRESGPPITLSRKQHSTFCSMKEAWEQLDSLMYILFDLNRQARQQESEHESVRLRLHITQQHVRTELSRWTKSYDSFEEGFCSAYSGDDVQKGFELLKAYHTMANIMAETCLACDGEIAFDSHPHKFLLMLRYLVNISNITAAVSLDTVDISKSIIDVGWIPPLYYIAVKCRVHRIRLQAVKMLESCSHREGVWDALTTACIARKVMEIEEKDFYNDFELVDNFTLDSVPGALDLALPTLPSTYRIREIYIALADGAQSQLSMSYKDHCGNLKKHVFSL